MKELIFIFGLLIAVSCTASNPQNQIASSLSTVINAPALDQDFPDPAVVRAADGWYYAYATQTILENQPYRMINIQVAKSRDLQTWIYVGEALPIKPSWAHQTQDFWAPDVIYKEGRYVMYYSALPDSREGFCLGVATSASPQGPFVDKGSPLICGPGFTELDPMAFDDPVTGQKLLYWGSGFGPIKVRALASDRMSFEPNSQAETLISPVVSQDPTEYRRLLEGAWVHYRQGYYYLFFSGDNCCSPPNYAVMVARSQNPWGPYEFPTSNWRDSIIIQADENFIGTGHNSVIEDSQGRTWTLYHAVDRLHPNLAVKIPGDREVRRALIVQELEWINGWPRLKSRDAAKPTLKMSF